MRAKVYVDCATTYISGGEPMCPGYLAEATCPGDGLKVVINLTKEAEQALAMVSFVAFPFRLDICHKHHKQRLCKINSTLGKISPGEEMSCVITRIFLICLIQWIWFSEESTCFKRTVDEYHIFGISMPKIEVLWVNFFTVYTFFG